MSAWMNAAFVAACVLLSCATPGGPARDTCSPRIVVALDAEGRPTPEWLDAIRDRVDGDELAAIAQTPKPLSTDEAAWRDLIGEGARGWCASIPRLTAPFRHVTPPRQPGILLGNQGGGDGFTREPDDVAIDLGEMSRAYANMPEAARRALIPRLLSHEYTHLLLHRWMDATGWSQESVADDPFLRALRTLFNEGIANYRSVDHERWVGAGGVLTQHARETLAALQPVMLERRQRLTAHPSAEDASRLLRNISQGPLERKTRLLDYARAKASRRH